MWETIVCEIWAGNSDALNDQLNKYANDGWEPVAVNYEQDNRYQCVFKRLKPQRSNPSVDQPYCFIPGTRS